MFSRIFIGLICLTAIFSSCKDNFKVGADYKDITVVYGLLSKSDTAQYIRITKGFYDELKDNLILAQNSDSIYYNNLDVKIEEINNGAVVNTIPLTRVDANLEGFAKDSGVFATTPNYVYKFKTSLNPSNTYKLVATNLTNGKVITAETPIINDNPTVFQIQYPRSQFDRINVSEINAVSSFNFTSPPNAAFFDVVIRLWYQEKDNNTLITTHKYKDLPVIQNIISSGGSVSAKMLNETFFRVLNSELGAAPSYISRYIDTPDVFVLAGGTVLKTYIDVDNAQGGLTYDQIKPYYTNIASDGTIGKDVIGILSTRVRRIEPSVSFTKSSQDSIISGSYTKSLNFVGVSTE